MFRPLDLTGGSNLTPYERYAPIRACQVGLRRSLVSVLRARLPRLSDLSLSYVDRLPIGPIVMSRYPVGPWLEG